MPIFMDRHDIAGLTAMEVAEGHKRDLEIQDQYGCRALTYWFDEARGTAFCLIEALHKNAVREMHDQAHGLIPNQIIEVESGLVEAFLGRIQDPDAAVSPDCSDSPVWGDTAFRTIMVTELKRHFLIESTSGSGDVRGAEPSRIYDCLVQERIDRQGGRIVKHAGDFFTASFASISHCVECSIEIQRNFEESNRSTSDDEMHVGIGLSSGDPVTGRNGLFEETLQLAEWLSYVASPGQILISSTARDYCRTEELWISHGKRAMRILTPVEEKLLKRMMDVTENAWNQNDFKIGDFCRRIGLSKSQLYRKTTSLTGYSPTEFIREFRLRKAKRMIETHHGNISQIAFETGFRSPSYFSKRFRRRFGVLPSDYARTIA